MIKDFWEEKHKNKDKLFLTGSDLKNVLNDLLITQEEINNKNILNIGIGTGQCTKELSHISKVSALDISQTALDNVKGFCKNIYNDCEKLHDNYYDYALSHLVVQHTNNTELEKQIKNVLRSLKYDGLFVIQIAYSLDNIIPDDNESELRQQWGSVVRNKEMIESIISLSGGKIKLYKYTKTFEKYNSGWIIIHINKG